MKPIFTKKRVLISILALTALSGTAAYFHFRDDPAPDLSRFPRPAYDEQAYAKFKSRCDTLKSHYTEYKPVDHGDIDEATSEVSLNDLALRRDPNALRCLRRHLAENKEALIDAEALLSLPRYSQPLVNPTNPLDIDSSAITSTRIAAMLCYRRAILAATDGNLDEAWRIVATIASGSRARMTASGYLIHYLTNTAIDGINRDLAVKISGFDQSAARVKKGIDLLKITRPETNDLRRALGGEMMFFQSALPRMRELIKQSDPMMDNLEHDLMKALGRKPPEPPPLWKRWAKGVGEWTATNWSLLNSLPNATMTEYARRLDPLMQSSDVLLPQKPKATTAFYARNYGGLTLVEMTTTALHIVQRKNIEQVASHRLTRIALAVRAYQISHDGKLPETIEATTAGFSPEDLTDPFDGKPLRYDAKTGKAWSVGPDMKDDAGFVDEEGESKDTVVVAPVLTQVK